MHQRRSRTKTEIAETLMPAVVAAAGSAVKQWPRYSHEYDDMVSVGLLVLVTITGRILEGRIYKNELGYLYRVARRKMLRYARSESRKTLPLLPEETDLPEAPNRRLPEAELIDRRERCLDDIYLACKDDTDRRIIELRDEGQTLQAIANELGIKKPAVCKRRRAIFRRYHRNQ